MELKISVGNSDFERIRKDGYYYIDKSGLIIELLKMQSEKVMLITRPRRFGKTLGMSMLAHFFDIREQSEELFHGLEIERQSEICSKWMNQYPTLFLTFKDVDGLNFESAYGMLKFMLAQVCNDHEYLEQSERVNASNKQIFVRIKNQTASVTEIKTGIYTVMKMMQEHYGKPVVLLMDEYDVPLAKASEHGYYNQMLEIIRTMMSTALKDNVSLQFAVITGCLRISKESIFTGTNNFVSDTISKTRLNEYFGFTQQDVDQILRDSGNEKEADKVKQWYDGYHFGDFDVYCPWDVMNYIYDLQHGMITEQPVSYWKNTSGNGIIRSFIDICGKSVTMKMETLMSGGYVIQRIEEDLTYDYLHSSEDNLWSILYLTGYLTRVREKDLKENERYLIQKNNAVALMIPNAEIRSIYEDTIIRWFDDNARKWDLSRLFQAVWNGKCEVITEELNGLLRRTISYHDYKEDFYHAFLTGIFTGAGYMAESNREHGEGRSDVTVSDPYESRVAVFEVKYAKSVEEMENKCAKALDQIKNKMYAAEYRENYDHVFCYGITFYKKRCLVKME